MDEAFQILCGEMERLGTKSWLMSCNRARRRDGQPYSDRSQPADTGVAVYFDLKGRQVSLACDKWNRVEDNVWAIAKHVEALRGQERWGVGSIEQAFRGYMAKKHHPDRGGDPELFRRLNEAWEQFQAMQPEMVPA